LFGWSLPRSPERVQSHLGNLSDRALGAAGRHDYPCRYSRRLGENSAASTRPAIVPGVNAARKGRRLARGLRQGHAEREEGKRHSLPRLRGGLLCRPGVRIERVMTDNGSSIAQRPIGTPAPASGCVTSNPGPTFDRRQSASAASHNRGLRLQECAIPASDRPHFDPPFQSIQMCPRKMVAVLKHPNDYARSDPLLVCKFSDLNFMARRRCDAAS
jgi:hypothetical protein